MTRTPADAGFAAAASDNARAREEVQYYVCVKNPMCTRYNILIEVHGDPIRTCPRCFSTRSRTTRR